MVKGTSCNDTRHNWLNFGGVLDHHADFSNRESGGYGGNELP